MATETLEANKPPLQDKDDSDSKLQPNQPENEVAEESTKDAVTEVAESDEKDETLEEKEDEKKEIDEHEDAEKDEEDEKNDEVEDEDEGEDEADDEEEDEAEAADEKAKAKKSEKSKKEKVTKKDPVTPTSDRPTRERKTVERFSVPSPSKLGKFSASKGLVIEKGRGTQLKDIPNVTFKLSKRKPDDNLQALHSLLFGKKTKAHNLKKNIGQFSGYVWAENEEKQRARVKERIDKCVKEKLVDFCDVLNIPINRSNAKKEELSVKLLEFLESPHVTTDVLLAEKEQKKKKRAKKNPSKSPGEASTETPAKKQKQSSQSGKKRKPSSDVEEEDKPDEEDKPELSDTKDVSDEDEDVAVPNNESDDEVSNSEEEEDKSKSRKCTSKKGGKEGLVAKADKTSSTKKTSVKAAKSSEKVPKKPTSKKSATEDENASASLSKSKQPASKKQRTVKEKQDTSGKAASKTSKTPVKDQGKGKSSKKAKVEPSTEDMHAVLADILKKVDFDTATLSDILRLLGTHFGLDLMHRKAEVKAIITDVINNMSDEEDGGEVAENDGEADADKDDDDGGEGDDDSGDGDDDEA